jgi:hypothetical protein
MDKPVAGKKQKRRWHKQGHYTVGDRHIPVVGFPFLNAPFRQYSNAELLQLGGHIRYFLKTQFKRHLNAGLG